MAYATATDLYDRFGQFNIDQLADKDNSNDSDKIANAVARALGDASAEIDGYLEGIYKLPLASVPTRLNGLALDLARYQLAGATINEDVENRYKLARSDLAKIRKGDIQLNIQEDTTGESAVFRANPRVFDFGGF